jgi:hypothetical protein
MEADAWLITPRERGKPDARLDDGAAAKLDFWHGEGGAGRHGGPRLPGRIRATPVYWHGKVPKC